MVAWLMCLQIQEERDKAAGGVGGVSEVKPSPSSTEAPPSLQLQQGDEGSKPQKEGEESMGVALAEDVTQLKVINIYCRLRTCTCICMQCTCACDMYRLHV